MVEEDPDTWNPVEPLTIGKETGKPFSDKVQSGFKPATSVLRDHVIAGSLP